MYCKVIRRPDIGPPYWRIETIEHARDVMLDVRHCTQTRLRIEVEPIEQYTDLLSHPPEVRSLDDVHELRSYPINPNLTRRRGYSWLQNSATPCTL